MTKTRLPVQIAKPPALTSGDDREPTPCEIDMAARIRLVREYGERFTPSAFDLLTDHTTGYIFNRALAEAKQLCNQCPIKAACWAKNAAAEEPWAMALTTGDGRTAPTHSEHCGSRYGYEKHRRAGEKSCDDCQQANAASTKSRMARSRAKDNADAA